MPEASVNENNNPLLQENEVGLAKQLFVASPTLELRCTKQGNHPQLRVTISVRANARHHGRAFLGREDVGAAYGARKRANSRGSLSSNAGALIAYRSHVTSSWLQREANRRALPRDFPPAPRFAVRVVRSI